MKKIIIYVNREEINKQHIYSINRIINLGIDNIERLIKNNKSIYQYTLKLNEGKETRLMALVTYLINAKVNYKLYLQDNNEVSNSITLADLVKLIEVPKN